MGGGGVRAPTVCTVESTGCRSGTTGDVEQRCLQTLRTRSCCDVSTNPQGTGAPVTGHGALPQGHVLSVVIWLDAHCHRPLSPVWRCGCTQLGPRRRSSCPFSLIGRTTTWGGIRTAASFMPRAPALCVRFSGPASSAGWGVNRVGCVSTTLGRDQGHDGHSIVYCQAFV